MLLKCKKIHVKNEQKKPCHFLWAINGVVHKLLFTKTYFFWVIIRRKLGALE